jgi:starch-binding outer membrane protein, SusD/RagB family
MKNIYYTIRAVAALTLSLVVMVGCDDFLETEPGTQIPADDALKSGKNVESTLIASYSDLVSFDVLGGRAQLYSELLSDNIALNEITLAATDFTGQVALRNTNILNKDVDFLWTNGYRAIARANAVVNAVDGKTMTDGTAASEQNKWKGEALFLRAITHFELVRLFAQPYSNNPASDLGIPIRIRSLSEDEKLPRATVDQVYAQVIKDLTDAIGLLPEKNGNRATVWTAKGYLARVYFNKLDYDNALTVAADVISNSGLALQENPFTSFRNVGNVTAQGGVVFQIVKSDNPFGSFRPQNNQYSLSQGTNGVFDALVASGAQDFRANATTGTAISGQRAFSRKWDANVANIPVVRLAELYLIHAEAAAQNSDLGAAADSYNAIRGFALGAGYTPVAFGTDAEALAAIRAERRLELVFEGDRLHELRRLKTPSFGEVRNGNTVIRDAVAYNAASLLLKIPVSETSGNTAIIQN